MDPSNQLFGHYLRYRMAMHKRMAEQHNGQPKVSALGAAIGKLCRNIMSYQATRKKPGLFPGPRDAQQDGAQYQQRKVSVPKGIRVVGRP
jgi:hypothetical protein